MAINKTQTTYFSSGEIKFSAIRNTFGDLAGTNVSASDYLRNVGDDVDWSDDSNITPRVPNATENADVATSSNWKTSQLRDSIVEYNITQSGNDEELEFADSNTSQWNSNLSKNVTKQMNVTGTIYANQVSKYALKFDDGDYNNLTISVPNGGAIYGEGGSAGGGNGGSALYIKNTASYDNVSITLGNNGKIWAGGGGGSNGNGGNSGSSISCSTNDSQNLPGGINTGMGNGRYWVASHADQLCKNAFGNSYSVGYADRKNKPDGNNSVRSRCRGGSFRAGQGWNASNQQGYSCNPLWNVRCDGIVSGNIAGGNGGNGGTGGVGQGFSNQSGPGSGNGGNSGNTNTCANSGASSSGNAGNSGGSGGTWGVSAGGNAGVAIVKKSTSINQGSSSNTIKGGIINV
jgi:hypothetical protein